MQSAAQKGAVWQACGLALTELMITLLLSSVLTLGLARLYAASSDAFQLAAGQSRMQRSARLAFDLISRGLHRAGYTGCLSGGAGMNAPADLADSGLPYEFNLPVFIQGYDAGEGRSAWLPPPALDLGNSYVAAQARGVPRGRGAGINLQQVQQGTDILTLRYLSAASHQLAAEAADIAAEIPLQVAEEGLDFGEDYFVMLHGCSRGRIIRAGDVPDAGSVSPGDLIRFRQELPGMNLPDEARIRFASDGSFAEGARVVSIVTETWFIAPGAGVNNRGRRPLSLWRKSALGRPVELLEGIEDLQLLYGVDFMRSDNVPDQYLPAGSVQNWQQVRTVSIRITANSVDDVGADMAPTHGCRVSESAQQFQDCGAAETDGLLRRTFIQVVRLRNRS